MEVRERVQVGALAAKEGEGQRATRVNEVEEGGAKEAV